MLEFRDDGPLLVFGGPYSNLPATKALLREAERRDIPAQRVICTGDVAAYCAEPEETATLIRGWGCHVIAGNCEAQLAGGAADCGCNFEAGTACDLLARGWYPFASERISPATRHWMGGLAQSLTFRFAGLCWRVVHGGVHEAARWVFASASEALAQEMAAAGSDVVIAGHAGVPFVARVGGGVWFNPGVVGMPANDGTPDVWYGLIEAGPDGVQLSTHRLAYDHRAAAAAMRRWGYADGYARSLITGIWPSFDVLPEAERAATGRRLASQRFRIREAMPLAAAADAAV